MSGPEDLIQVDPDIELLGDYLARELDPEQVAAVERRLAEDEAFRTRAAPLIALWSIPPRWKREAMPREKLEKHWDAFTRRAGFTHQRRKRRRRWMIVGAVLLLPIIAFLWLTLNVMGLTLVGWDPPIDGPGVVDLRDGTRVELDSGATLVSADNMTAFGTALLVRLDGSATFHMRRAVGVSVRALTIGTEHGSLVAMNASFRVTHVNDSVFVQVYRRAPDPSRREILPSQVALRARGHESSLIVAPGNSGTMVSGPSGGARAGYSWRADTVFARAQEFARAGRDSGGRLINRRSPARVVLEDGISVELESRARLFSRGAGAYELEGAARFRGASGQLHETMLRTPAAVLVLSSRADLSIHVAEDTTIATLHRRPKQPIGLGIDPPRDEILVVSSDLGSDILQIGLMEGQSVRWVRGQRPVVSNVARSAP